MNKKERKKIDFVDLLFWIMGGAASFVPVLGEYPIALAFFAAAYTKKVQRLVLCLVFFGGVAILGTSLQTIRYELIGITFIGIWRLAEYKGRSVRTWLAGLLMGGLFVFLTLSGTFYSFGSRLSWGYFCVEGIFIATLTILFQELPEFGRKNSGWREASRQERRDRFMGERMHEETAEVFLEPGKERLLEGARALGRLSKTFSTMPDYQEQLSHEEMERLFHQLENGVCSGCAKARQCWVVNAYRTCLATEELFFAAATKEPYAGEHSENRGENSVEANTSVAGANDSTTTANASAATVNDSAATANASTAATLQEEPVFLKNCLRKEAYMQAVRDLQEKAKLTLLWQNRLAESRMALAGQLQEMSEFLSGMALEVYGREEIEDSLKYRIKKGLESRYLEVLDLKGDYSPGGVLEFNLFLRVSRGSFVSIREVEKEVSRICRRKMTALRDGQRIVNSKTVALALREAPAYNYLHGVARATKHKEGISGDNFTITLDEQGTILMGLSDGMGSGLRAGKDSEAIMDLVEQFFEAGFRMETAVNLIHATCLAKSEEPMGATVDLCTINLYEGTYQFLKQGAVTSFLLEQGNIRRIQGHSMPIGIYSRDSFTLSEGKLEKEAYIIMISDGILDAFRHEDGERVIEELLLFEEEKNPKALANKILEEAIVASDGLPRDDMTVLVLNIWQ